MHTLLTVIALLLCLPVPAFAAEANTLTLNMDTVWVTTAAALVFFMQAGFALLESGMARAKNTVNVIMKNYVDACVGSLMYWLVGFGIMFGINHSGWFGEDHFIVDVAGDFDYTFLLFQTMFAATAVTIASGAMAERTHYRAYLFGAIIVTSFIYPIFGSWAWGGHYGGQGWLAELGFIDFAGSTVVHSVGGWVALAGIIVLGPRMGRFTQDGRAHPIPGHNLTSVPSPPRPTSDSSISIPTWRPPPVPWGAYWPCC
jgi:Amt family ammonium transporter